MDLGPLSRLAHRQLGLVTRRQAIALGVSERRWRHLHDAQVLVAIRPRVSRLAGVRLTPIVEIKAAVLAAPVESMASHPSAALLWGAGVSGTDPVHLVSLARERRFTMPHVVVHRPTDLLDLRPVVRQGVAATNPLRTLCDLGAVVPDAVSDALTRFMIAGFVRPDAVIAAVERHSARGRSGIVALRRALAELPLGSKPPDSVLEPAVADLLRRYGLPAARFHAVIVGYEVDFHFDDTPVILESDGWSTHGLDRDQFEWDREKDAVLTAAGYVVCRFSWRQITQRPGWTAKRLRETLLRWAPRAAGISPSQGSVD